MKMFHSHIPYATFQHPTSSTKCSKLHLYLYRHELCWHFFFFFFALEIAVRGTNRKICAYFSFAIWSHCTHFLSIVSFGVFKICWISSNFCFVFVSVTSWSVDMQLITFGSFITPIFFFSNVTFMWVWFIWNLMKNKKIKNCIHFLMFFWVEFFSFFFFLLFTPINK